MKYILVPLVLAVALISCKNSARRTAINRTEIQLDSVSIMPSWENEGVIKLELIKEKTTSIEGSLSESASSTSDIELKIVKGKEDSTWDCTWSVVDIKTPSIKNPIAKRIENLVKGFRYNFTLDSDGVFVQLNNWEEIQQMGYQAVDMIVNELKKDPNIKKDALGQMRAMFEQMFDTQEKIETYLIQDVQLYFALGGVEMSTQDTLVSYTYFMHPLLSEYMEQTVEVIYQKAFSDSTCNMQIIQYISEDELLWATEALIEKFIPKEVNKEDLLKEMENIQFDLNIVSNYNISFKTGLTEKVTYTKSAMVGNTERIEKMEITRK